MPRVANRSRVPEPWNQANYVLIGAFTLITGLALLAFGLWAAKYSSDRTWQEYRVVFREAVTGLSVGSPVQYNGIAVGSITELNLVPDDPRQVVARIRLNSNTPVKTDTRAKLAITSLTGPSIIQLSGGTPQSPALTTVNKDPAPIIPTTPSALQNITDVANRIVERMDQILSDRNVASINATLANLETISGGLADRDQGTQALLLSARDAARSLDTTLKTTNGTIERLDRNLVQQLPGIIDKLDGTLAKLDSAAGNADSILGENRAAINSFANDGLGQLGPTLTELRGLIRDLRRVSDRLENNPARYLLGRDAPKEFEPNEPDHPSAPAAGRFDGHPAGRLLHPWQQRENRGDAVLAVGAGQGRSGVAAGQLAAGTGKPSAARMVDSPRINVRPTPSQMEIYKGASWAQPATDMIEDTLLRGFEDSGRIRGVARSTAGIRADYKLSTDVRRFESDYQARRRQRW